MTMFKTHKAISKLEHAAAFCDAQGLTLAVMFLRSQITFIQAMWEAEQGEVELSFALAPIVFVLSSIVSSLLIRVKGGR